MLPQDQESQRNLVLAIALSLAVLIGWQFLYAAPRAKLEQEQRQAQVAADNARKTAAATQTVPGAPTAPGAKTSPSQTPAIAAPAQPISRDAALGAAPPRRHRTRRA